MKIILICLLFVGCYHEKETEPVWNTVYREGTLSFFTNDTSLSMGNWRGAHGEQYYMKYSGEPIIYTPEVGKRLKITITFEVTEAIYDSIRPVLY